MPREKAPSAWPGRTRRLLLAAAAALAGVYLLRPPPDPADPAANDDGADRRIDDDPEAFAAELGRRQNLVVGFGDPASFYAPPWLPEDAVVPHVALEAARREDAKDALRGIARAFDAYPEGCLGRIIKGVFVAGSIRIDGTEAGGTYGPDWIFVAAPRSQDAATRRLGALLGVHHETSSFLWLRDDALQRAFRALEPAGWVFPNSTADQIAQGLHGSAPAPSTGFLSAYGASTPENDFNTYAEILFSEPERLRRLAAATPLVARKLRLVLAAYVAVDDRLEGRFAAAGLPQT